MWFSGTTKHLFASHHVFEMYKHEKILSVSCGQETCWHESHRQVLVTLRIFFPSEVDNAVLAVRGKIHSTPRWLLYLCVNNSHSQLTRSGEDDIEKEREKGKDLRNTLWASCRILMRITSPCERIVYALSVRIEFITLSVTTKNRPYRH